MAPDHSDRSTADGFLDGDPEANRIIDGYLEKAAHRFRRRLGWETEEAVAIARVKLFEDLRAGRFRFDCKLSSYLWQVVGNVAIDLIRKQRVRAEADSDTVADGLNLLKNTPNPMEALLCKEDVDEGYKMVLTLPEDCRELLAMRLTDGLEYAEIAEKTGKSAGSLRVKFHACKRKALELLKKLTSGD